MARRKSLQAMLWLSVNNLHERERDPCKIARIRPDLDAVVDSGPMDITVALAGPLFLDNYQFPQPDDLIRSLGEEVNNGYRTSAGPLLSLAHRSCQKGTG